MVTPLSRCTGSPLKKGRIEEKERASSPDPDIYRDGNIFENKQF
jgi:hypothetical protein